MVKVTIYPACLKCVCPKFIVETSTETQSYPLSASVSFSSSRIMCENFLICKFIDGQEPIAIGDDE